MREATGVRYLKLYGMKMRTNLQKFYPICFLIRSVIMTTRKAFYHAFVAGLFANAGYIVESNYENGLGRSDLVIKDRKLRRAIVIELKIAKNKDCLADECYKALQQIEEKKYATKIEQDGFKKVIRYGIAFYKKNVL